MQGAGVSLKNMEAQEDVESRTDDGNGVVHILLLMPVATTAFSDGSEHGSYYPRRTLATHSLFARCTVRLLKLLE